MDEPVILSDTEAQPFRDLTELDSLPILPTASNQGTTSEEQLQTILDSTHKYAGVLPNQTPVDYLKMLEAMSDLEESTPEDEDEIIEIDDMPQSQISNVPHVDLRTGVCYDPRMRFHVEVGVKIDDKFHPEDPRRIIAIYSILGENGLLEESPYNRDGKIVANPLKRVPSRYATKEECCRVHSEDHFEELQATAEADDATLIQKAAEGDSVYYNQSTYSSALLAAGSAIETTLAVVNGEVKNAIAIIRPPGHHAECTSSQGFCHFDNVAVAVKNAQHQVPAIKKVLIVDWDIHHGNGIQEAFEDDPNVLYISLHVFKNGTFYPGTQAGAINRDGVGEGKGRNINIAWEDTNRTDGDYMMAFQHIIMPVAYEFDPDLVMVASGFDAAEGDDLGDCHVSPSGYSQMTHMLMSLANGKVVVCLEGGYNLHSISISALAVTKTLMGQPPLRVSDTVPTKSGARTIFEVIRHHQQYWKSVVPKDKSIRYDAITEATRLHDVVRCVQAEQLFKAYKMFPLPIHREKVLKTECKSFDHQVLASPDFRKAKELLLIFHEQPQLTGMADPVTGEVSLSSPKVIDSVMPFIDWANEKGFGIIDINLPDFYTGLSKDGDKAKQANVVISNTQMQIVSSYVWDNYVETSAAKKIVMLGIGNTFSAVQRIIATHPEESFLRRTVRAIGVIEGEVPGRYTEPLLNHYDHYYPLWTKIWVSRTNKIFTDMKNGHLSKKYGTVQRSRYETLDDLLTFHVRDLKSEILGHFKRPAETTPSVASDEEADGMDKTGSDSSGRSAPGKRAREDGDEQLKSARVRVSEER